MTRVSWRLRQSLCTAVTEPIQSVMSVTKTASLSRPRRSVGGRCRKISCVCGDTCACVRHANAPADTWWSSSWCSNSSGTSPPPHSYSTATQSTTHQCKKPVPTVITLSHKQRFVHFANKQTRNKSITLYLEGSLILVIMPMHFACHTSITL